MKKASIIGFGDVRFGDHCIGSCVIEALEQEHFGESIQLVFVGHDPRDADLWLYDIDFAIILGAVSTGGQPGEIHLWHLDTLKRQFDWLARNARAVKTLGEALVRAHQAGGIPEDVIFVWIEPRCTDAFGLSREMRKTFRKVIRTVKKELVKRKFLHESTLKVAPIYRLKVPSMVL